MEYTKIFDLVTQYAGSMGGKLSDFGVGLVWTLFSIQLCWLIFKKLLSGDDVVSIVAELMMLLLTTGILAWIIGNIGEFTAAVSGGFDWIAAKLVDVSDSKNLLDTIFKSLAKISSEIFDGMSKNPDRTVWQAIKDTVAGMGSFLLKILVLLVYLAATVVAMAIFLWSQIQVLLAAALLPAILPFFILPVTQKFADGMIDFFVKSAAMKMVAVLLMSICIHLLDGSNAIVASVQVDGMALDLVGMTTLLFVAAVTLLMMLQVSNLTNAMFSGQTLGLSQLMPRGLPKPSAPKPPAPPVPTGK